MTTKNFCVLTPHSIRFKALALLFLSATLLALGHGRAEAANTLQVAPTGSDSGNCVSAACATIGYAVGEASADDTIQIAAGDYDEQIEITVPGLTLQGAGATTVIGPEGDSVVEQTEITLADGVDGVTLKDLAVVSAAQGKPAILIEGPEAIDDTTLDGVAVSGIGPSTPPTTVGNGLEIKAPGSGWKVLDSSFSFHYLALVVFGDLEDFTIEGSSFNDNRAGFYVERTLPLTSSSTGEIDGLQMSDTTFDDEEYVPLYFEGLSNALIEGVTVTDTGVGVSPLPAGGRAVVINLKAGAGENIEIADSTFTGSVNEGILVQARGWAGDSGTYVAAPASLDGFELRDSTVTGNGGPGVIVNNQSTLTGVSIHNNRIVGNGTAGFNVTAPVNGVFARNTEGGAPPVPTAENWFACNESPAAGTCAAVNAPVQAPTWLVLGVDTSFETLGVGEQTAVVAAIESSAGGDPLTPLPGSPEAQFSSALGSFEPAAEPLLDGVASPTFIAGQTPGTGVITVEVDGEEASTPIAVHPPDKVDPPAPPAPPAPLPPAPEPPTIEPPANKGPTTVPNSGTVTVATVGCASESCTVKTQGTPSVKIGGKSYKVTVKVPKNLGAGDSGKVKVVLPKKVREALAEEGKGKLKLKLKVTGSDGSTKTVTVTIVLKGKGAKAKGG